MTDTNMNTTAPTAPTATTVPSVNADGFAVLQFKEKYNFKTTKLNTDALSELEVLATAGKIALEDVIEKDSAGADVLVGKKRSSEELTFECIDLLPLLQDTTLSLAKIKTIQDLVQRHVASKNKTTVDKAETEYTDWQTALEDGLAQRKAGVKVTQQMVTDTTKLLVAHLTNNTSTKAGGIKLTEKLANKKFSVTACNTTRKDVLEYIQGLVMAWFDTLTPAEELANEPVMSLWADQLEETLNPKQDDTTVDMF